MSNEARLSDGLTQRQFSFFNIIIEQMRKSGEMQPKQAAIEAGYSEKGAAIVACRLLKKPEGQAYLKSLHTETKSSSIASLDWVMEKLVRVVRAGIADDGAIKQKSVKDALRALTEINKIKGHYAPEKKFNLNLDMDDIQEARARELTIKYTREY
jgi:phage terminase small subunit